MNTSLYARETPISAQDLASTPFLDRLSKVQGGILKSHGRDHVELLLLTIPDAADTQAVRRQLGLFASMHVTSALAQLEQTRWARGGGTAIADGDTSVFGSLFLSAAGYARLGFSLEQFRDTSFVDGMKVAGPKRLGDPAVERWDWEYQRPVHAMLLLASDDRDALAQAAASTEKACTRVGITVMRQAGGATRRPGGGGFIDPFGYTHGLSQPLFFANDRPGGQPPQCWDAYASPRLALARDPLVDDPDALGSYLVYRKLQTDVDGFNQRLGALATALGDGTDTTQAAALVCGRYRAGAPLAHTPPAHDDPGDDFDYAQDPAGRLCPVHSHVRRSNPRGSSGPQMLQDEREHRIVRRGANYRSDADAGMLFMCFQAKIWRQFEFLQKRWHNEAPPQAGAEPHPLIAGHGDVFGVKTWPTETASGPKVPFSSGDFVKLKGGEYFFAPSMPFLQRLARD